MPRAAAVEIGRWMPKADAALPEWRLMTIKHWLASTALVRAPIVALVVTGSILIAPLTTTPAFADGGSGGGATGGTGGADNLTGGTGGAGPPGTGRRGGGGGGLGGRG